MRDEVTERIPGEAFTWPDSMHVNIGTLSLPSEKEIEHAKSLLKRLDLKFMLQQLRTKSRGSLAYDIPATSSKKTPPPAENPVKVSMIGIKPLTEPRLTECKRMDIPVYDREHILAEYCLQIRRLFMDARLLTLNHNQQKHKFFPLHASLIRTKRLFTKEPNTASFVNKYLERGKLVMKQLAVNTTDLHAKYRKFPWARDIQLEKLSIREMGMKRFLQNGLPIGQGYHEIACAPLPGTSIEDLAMAAKVQDSIVYEPVKPLYDVDPGSIYDVKSR